MSVRSLNGLNGTNTNLIITNNYVARLPIEQTQATSLDPVYIGLKGLSAMGAENQIMKVSNGVLAWATDNNEIITTTLPLLKTNSDISLKGITAFGGAGKILKVNGNNDAFEWATETDTTYSGTAPIVITGNVISYNKDTLLTFNNKTFGDFTNFNNSLKVKSTFSYASGAVYFEEASDNGTNSLQLLIENNSVANDISVFLPNSVNNTVLVGRNTTDTLTNKTITSFIGGSNAVITAPSTTGTLAIAKWTLTGTNLYPISTGTNVVIGTATNTDNRKLFVSGNAEVNDLYAKNIVLNNGTTQSYIRFYDTDSSGPEYVDLKFTPGSTITNHTLFLPGDKSGTLAITTNVIPYNYGGTGFTTYTQGDIIYASANNTLSKLPKGSTGTILKMNATVPYWGTDINTNFFSKINTEIYATSITDTLTLGKNQGLSNTYRLYVEGDTYISGNLASSRYELYSDSNLSINYLSDPGSAYFYKQVLTWNFASTITSLWCPSSSGYIQLNVGQAIRLECKNTGVDIYGTLDITGKTTTADLDIVGTLDITGNADITGDLSAVGNLTTDGHINAGNHIRLLSADDSTGLTGTYITDINSTSGGPTYRMYWNTASTLTMINCGSSSGEVKLNVGGNERVVANSTGCKIVGDLLTLGNLTTQRFKISTSGLETFFSNPDPAAASTNEFLSYHNNGTNLYFSTPVGGSGSAIRHYIGTDLKLSISGASTISYNPMTIGGNLTTTGTDFTTPRFKITNGDSPLQLETWISNPGGNVGDAQKPIIRYHNNGSYLGLFTPAGGSSPTAGYSIQFTVGTAQKLKIGGLQTHSSQKMSIDGYYYMGYDYVGATSTINLFQLINHGSGSTNGATFLAFMYAGTSIGQVYQSGTTNVVYSTSSDYRLKDDIVECDSMLDTIDKMNVKEYTFKNDKNENIDQKYIGFIAHEVQELDERFNTFVSGKKDEIAPYCNCCHSFNCVKGQACMECDEDGICLYPAIDKVKYQSIDYGKITPICIKGIQELHTIIKSQQVELDTYKSIINKLITAKSFVDFKKSL